MSDNTALQQEIQRLRGELAEAKERLSAERSEAGVRFDAMVERIEDGVFLLDETARILYATPRCERLFGLSARELVGRDSNEFVHPDDRASVGAEMLKLLEYPGSTVHAEFRVLHPDGVERWVECSARNFLSEPAVKAVISNFREITERRRALASRSLLATIVESSSDAIISVDLHGVISSWNPGAEHLYGWTASEIVGRPFATLVPDGRSEEEPLVLDLSRRTVPVSSFETRRLRKDGAEIEVTITASALRDGAGNVSGVARIERDLTDRRMAEATLRRTEEQLRQAQKMEAIGALAGGVAHDFNNLLSVILGYSSLALGRLSPSAPLYKDIEEIDRAAERAASLTEQLLAFSRQQVLQPRVIEVGELVTAMERMLRRLLSEDIDLVFRVAPPPSRIRADPVQVQQLLMNLVVNARDAMPRGGKLTVETQHVTFDASQAAEHIEVKPGPYVMLAVSDTGVGMDAATRERIFEPFFTTKQLGKGTGLGLSTVFGIVKQSEGHIWVYSEPGQGSIFKVYFPQTELSVQRPAAPEPPTRLRGWERILIVEDEEQVRKITGTILRSFGYDVLEAQDGNEAIAICERFEGQIQLMITDVIMPSMHGTELTERVALIRPEMRVVYVSGYTENSIIHRGVLEAGVSFLAKPIIPEALARKVREVLDRAD